MLAPEIRTVFCWSFPASVMRILRVSLNPYTDGSTHSRPTAFKDRHRQRAFTLPHRAPPGTSGENACLFSAARRDPSYPDASPPDTHSTRADFPTRIASKARVSCNTFGEVGPRDLATLQTSRQEIPEDSKSTSIQAAACHSSSGKWRKPAGCAAFYLCCRARPKQDHTGCVERPSNPWLPGEIWLRTRTTDSVALLRPCTCPAWMR